MQSATERRQLVLEFISNQRKVSMEDIMHEFDISRSTAKRDVQLPTTQLPIASPYVNMGISFLKQANVLWLQIYQIVKDNCETPIGNSNPNDDLMERLLG